MKSPPKVVGYGTGMVWYHIVVKEVSVEVHILQNPSAAGNLVPYRTCFHS